MMSNSAPLLPGKNITIHIQCLRKSGFFLGVGPKTQGRKNSNSRKISQKLKDFFPGNSRKRQISSKSSKFCLKITTLDEKIENFPKTQGFSHSSSQKTVKNSRNGQFCKSHLAKKTRLNTKPGLQTKSPLKY